MVDHRHLRVQRDRTRCAICGDQRAVTASYAPIDLAVFVSLHVQHRDFVEFAAIDIARYRIDHRVPAIAGFEIQTGCAVAAGPGSLFGAAIELIERANEVGALLGRKHRNNALLAPWRARLVDFEIQLPGDLDERIFVRRMQPAAADVESNIRRCHDGLAASADAVACFEYEDGEAPVLQRPRRAEPGRAGPDDCNIDFGGEGHALPLACWSSGMKPAALPLSSRRKRAIQYAMASRVRSPASATTSCPRSPEHRRGEKG